MNTETLLYKDECYRIQACIFEVNRKLGSGFLEAVYQEALEIELEKADIPFEAQKALPVYYDGKALKQTYRADFVCFGNIIVEIKAVAKLAETHKAQVVNYLAATGFRLGLLVNFAAHPKAEILRVIH
ncbi:MAG: GxxExxY protein [Treponema sp.]|jgi:GxxExxY protein|nr:GxxExxY protein [Treponema sp.]